MNMGGKSLLKRTPTQIRQAHTGFTIVETMIVLAITGVLFVSFIGTVSGKQNKVRFQQAINDAKTQIEQVVSETQSGYFPSSSNFTCTVAGGSLSIDDSTSSKQGTNQACVFLGKAIQFGNNDGSGNEYMTIYTLAGKTSAREFADSGARVVDALTENKTLQWELKAASATYANGNAATIAFTSYFASAGSEVYGSPQSLQVIPIRGSDLGANSPFFLNANILNSYDHERNPSEGIRVCFNSGTTQQSGLITIGAAGSSNSVTLDIKNKLDCAD